MSDKELEEAEKKVQQELDKLEAIRKIRQDIRDFAKSIEPKKDKGAKS